MPNVGRIAAGHGACSGFASLLLIWAARSPMAAFAGTALTGVGYSIVFPSLDVEAMRRVAPGSRGLVLAAYLACFDLGPGAAGPLAGVVAATFGLPAAFLAAAGAALSSLALTAPARSGRIGTR